MMRSRPLIAAAVLVAGALSAGCQTFIGLDDAQGHLPRLKGDYLFGIERKRKVGGAIETLRLRGSATLDVEARSLDLSFSILNATTGASLSESAITDIVFPDDSTSADFTLNIQVPDQAVTTTQDAQDQTLSAAMTLFAEGDYSFCALAQGDDHPTLGTVLLETSTATPPPDVACDAM